MAIRSPHNIFPKLEDCVRKYYSIELHKTQQLKTDGEFKNVVSEKINKLIAHDMVFWNNFVSSVAETYPSCNVLDQSYLQFPNLQVALEISEKTFEEMTIRRSCTIVFSLLCPYFTVYFEDNIRRKAGDYVVDLSIYHATSMDDETKQAE